MAKNAGSPIRTVPDTGRAPMTVEQALADPHPLVRFQAQRQLDYAAGTLRIDPDRLRGLVQVWERNRAWSRYHHARA
uniref:hypothetical protein n=1 Tax=Amycolatopsis sp. CA-151526 TaxID=3239921 RepID=UPI003F4989C1